MNFQQTCIQTKTGFVILRFGKTKMFSICTCSYVGFSLFRDRKCAV